MLLAGLALAYASPVTAQQDCININTAGLLQAIIHIGPERATQILQLRQERPFASVDELVRVRGIAEARLRDIREQGLACVTPADPIGSVAKGPEVQSVAEFVEFGGEGLEVVDVLVDVGVGVLRQTLRAATGASRELLIIHSPIGVLGEEILVVGEGSAGGVEEAG